jgi:dCMP deaminase
MWTDEIRTALEEVTRLSSDAETKVGVVIADKDDNVVCVDCNKLTPGVPPILERIYRPTKYDWMEHAERAAIYSAARLGIPLQGMSMYMRWFPCAECARAITLSGISRLYAQEPDFKDSRWGNEFIRAKYILEKGNVEIITTE